MIIGQQVTPVVRLVRPLGQGAMGSVWVADHLALDTQVAVKFIAPEYARDPEHVARFRREATAAAQIKSPHVAQVFDHGITPEGAPYIVMELLEGETLKSRIRRLGPLPVIDVVRLVVQTAKALGRAHQLGIVHRDIKPDNLFLLDLEGEPFLKVLDFGIAKQAQSGELGMTSTGSMLGTPFFMSPEQLLSSKHVDFRADLWALAVTAYQALTGQLPFTGETLGALSVAVHTAVFTPPSALRPGLPTTIDAWMARALQREPSARFGSAKEAAESLEQAAGMTRSAMASIGDTGATASPAAFHLSGAQGAGLKLSESGNGAQPLSGSGAHARTLQGMASTGSTGQQRRALWIVAAGVLFTLAAAGAGLSVWARFGAGEEAETTTPPSPEPAAPAAPAEPQERAGAVEAPTSAPSVTTSAAAEAPPVTDAGTATSAPATATATTATATSRPRQPQQPAPAETTAKPAKTPPSATKTPPKKPIDTVGF